MSSNYPVYRFTRPLPLLGVHVPVKEISETQKSLGEFMVTLPRFKSVRAVEGTSEGANAVKCVLFKHDGKE